MSQSVACDVLVIGGGATGAGVMLDLALRGLRVVLAEQSDLNTGTSGRYHGLLHSGARYAVRDPESAKECIDENRILRRIAPNTIEDTGGLFMAVPADPPKYVEPFIQGCAAAGIPAEEITVAQALKQEPTLNPAMSRVFRVPDGSCDSFDLIHALVQAAEQLGSIALTYHRVTQIDTVNGKIAGAILENRRTGEAVNVIPQIIVNAAGPWAGEIGTLVGLDIQMRHSKGVMVAMNMRWVNTVINRLHPPGDGDILIPVGTVCVIGTTSIRVNRPDELPITSPEITLMLDEGELMIPGFRRARALRAWAGVRPLYEPPSKGNATVEGRAVKRTFSVLDHADEGAAGMLSIIGGKLTTYRLMAEKVSDAVCKQLGVDKSCTTATTELPAPHNGSRRYHALPNRQESLEHSPTHNGLICECELVTRPQLEQAIVESGSSVRLDDLRRDLRLGMGPCQAGFCAYRAAGIVQETCKLSREDSIDALHDFVDERFRGNRPLLWGHQLRQALLDESIYRRTLGLSAAQPISEPVKADRHG
ncbi:MAG: anaerobic glycerol-3-phosphate dehydrogenase subunit GlpA [Chloroflexota bacterium]